MPLSIARCGLSGDLRVLPHRRINSEGRPTVEDIAAQIRAEREESGPGPADRTRVLNGARWWIRVR